MHKFLKNFLIIAVLFAPISSFANSDYGSFSDDDFESYEDEKSVKIYDPFEKANRRIYVFNDYLDRYFLQHVAVFYRKGVPQTARLSIRNVLTNLSLPMSAVNSLMQGKVDNGLATFSHFLINSTLGLGGIFNVAGEKNIRYKSEDFGQTLGHYGVQSGFYLMLPVLGPSTLRDLGGYSVEAALGPLDFNILEVGGSEDLITKRYRVGLAAMSGIDKRESLINILDDIRTESFDPYATIRSAFLQKRFTDIKN